MIAYTATATDLTVAATDMWVSVVVNNQTVLSFEHDDPEEAAYVLVQLLTTHHGDRFERIG